jgi:hypothetical protein
MRDLAPTREEFWFETYGRVAADGRPTRFAYQAEALGRWFDVCAFRVGRPGERRVSLLFTDISERIRAQLGHARAHLPRERAPRDHRPVMAIVRAATRAD